MFLVSYLTSNDERQRLLKIFQALDLNADGQLSRDELINGKINIVVIFKLMQFV